MENVMKKIGKASSFLTKYIGIIIICFSVIAFSGAMDSHGQPNIPPPF